MQDTDASDFMKTVEEIEHSEKEAEKVREDARQKAEQIIRKGKESALKIKSETREEIVKSKNGILQAGKEKIEKEVQAIVDKARQDAEKLKKKSVPKTGAIAILKKFTLEQ